MKNNNLPGSHPKMNLELPDEDANSLVAESGKNWDNGYNFDERIDDEEEDILINEADKFNPEQAKQEKEKRIEELKKSETEK